MLGIREKLMLGFGGLLATVAVIVMLTLSQIAHLGQAIDIILRENYRSVEACQNMKEALERIDSGVLFVVAGEVKEGRQLIDNFTVRFEEALKVELGNLTLPGERDKAEQIRTLFSDFSKGVGSMVAGERPRAERQADYFDKLLPQFLEIKGLAQQILEMNQANMVQANDNARFMAASARQRMLTAVVICATIALLFTLFIQQWILRPIQRLIESSNEIRDGNLDLVLDTHSRDEIGLLSESFNDMASALRRMRQQDRLTLMRSKRATEEVFKALPGAIAVLDLQGMVEIATESAAHHFGLEPGASIHDLHWSWLPELVARALEEGVLVEADEENRWVHLFIEGREFFFQPLAIPIHAEPPAREPTGTAVILNDVTQVHEQLELKRGVVATVSHQLRTPLHALRMSIHLLMEERVGKLNDKQLELCMAAREESARLAEILENLLDLNRIAAGKSHLETAAVRPITLVSDSVERFRSEAKSKGVSLVSAVAETLPEVAADRPRIGYVFENLLSNALRYTQAGGAIRIEAAPDAAFVRFSLTDTGTGIEATHLSRLFEPFFRVPGQDQGSGVGLGLAIVKEILQAHGGTIDVSSGMGQGTCFSFTLPLWPEAPAGSGPVPQSGAVDPRRGEP